MPVKKLLIYAIKICKSKKHFPPFVQNRPPGKYEHWCVECGKVTEFTIKDESGSHEINTSPVEVDFYRTGEVEIARAAQEHLADAMRYQMGFGATGGNQIQAQGGGGGSQPQRLSGGAGGSVPRQFRGLDAIVENRDDLRREYILGDWTIERNNPRSRSNGINPDQSVPDAVENQEEHPF